MKRIMILAIMAAFLCILPLPASASTFTSLKTVGFDYWYFQNDIPQAVWLAQRHDWIVGAAITEAGYDAMKAANPNVKIMPYIAYTTYEKNIQDWIQNWCQQNGYNFEDTFYHYYYDTEVDLLSTNNPDKIIVKGYGGGSAATIEESRAPSTWASYAFGINQTTGVITRNLINPTSPTWRLGYEAYIRQVLMPINESAGKYADGVFLDSFHGPASPSLHLENTTEFISLGITNSTAATARESDDLVASMHQIQENLSAQLGKNIVVSPNAGDADDFYYWAKAIYADRPNDYRGPGIAVSIEYMTRGGSSMPRITRLKQAYDSMQAGTVFFSRDDDSGINVSERVKQFLVVGHYLLQNPNYYAFYHHGGAGSYGGYPLGQLNNTHWHKNMEYDIGAPVSRASQDYWGVNNTDRFFTFAKFTNASNGTQNYEVIGREFANALVLGKFGQPGGIAHASEYPVTFSLNGTYSLLLPDNSLGPPITEIALGNNEGAILIKEQPPACAIKPDLPPCDSCVDGTELTAFISRWYISNADVTLKDLMEAIGLWKKAGC